MTRKLFGTDGIRGTANVHPMTAMTALMVGQAAALHFKRGDHRHRVIIGKDTRLSGYMLENALTSGFVSMRRGRDSGGSDAHAGHGISDRRHALPGRCDDFGQPQSVPG